MSNDSNNPPASGPQFRHLQEKATAAAKKSLQIARQKLHDLNIAMDDAGLPLPFLDQYAGKRVPFSYSKLYGPIPLITTRRTGDNTDGLTEFATVSDPGKFFLPRKNNILVGREGKFWWTGGSAYGFVSLTYGTGSGLSDIKAFPSKGDIFDSVANANGGAMVMNGFESGHLNTLTTGTPASLAWDLQLYDRKKARALQDSAIPSLVFSGQGFANKDFPQMAAFDAGAEIEPRLYVREAQWGSFSATSQAEFDSMQFSAYLNIVFDGFLELEV